MKKHKNHKVLLTEDDVCEEAIKILEDVAEVKLASSPNEEDILKEIKDADALLVWRAHIGKKIINAGDRLKIIAIRGVGSPYIDYDAATSRGIFVTNVPGGNAISVAEHTFALILTLAKGIIWADEYTRSGNWGKTEIFEGRTGVGFELYGKILGIIGLGSIGYEVAKRARAFGMNILAYDPYVSKERADNVNAQLVDLETLLRMSDIVTIHVPLSSETTGMIGEKQLKMMKKTSILVNTSRGNVIDEKALYKALKEGWIASAGIDVYEKEPPDINNPIFKLENVIFTPHIAGLPARAHVAVLAAQQIVRFLRGELPINVVNKDVLKSFDTKKVN